MIEQNVECCTFFYTAFSCGADSTFWFCVQKWHVTKLSAYDRQNVDLTAICPECFCSFMVRKNQKQSKTICEIGQLNCRTQMYGKNQTIVAMHKRQSTRQGSKRFRSSSHSNTPLNTTHPASDAWKDSTYLLLRIVAAFVTRQILIILPRRNSFLESEFTTSFA